MILSPGNTCSYIEANSSNEGGLKWEGFQNAFHNGISNKIESKIIM